MDEKLALHRLPPPQSRHPVRRHRVLPFVLLSALAFLYYLAARPSVAELARSKLMAGGDAHVQTKEVSTQEQEIFANIPFEQPARGKTATELQETAGTAPVDLEAHIMSQCPDAQDCLQQLIIPAMEEVAPLVNFTLSFIGSIDTDGESVQCKHGPMECLGNMLMLCADSLYPDVPIISLGFANCLISEYERLSEREFVEGCALQHAVDFQQLNACVSEDARGQELLRKSVRWSQKEGVVYSCTVRVNGKKWCVRDDGAWKECPDGSSVGELVDKIKTLAKDAE